MKNSSDDQKTIDPEILHLADMFMESVAYDDRGINFAYGRCSRVIIKPLLEMGKEIIPHIALHFKKYEESLWLKQKGANIPQFKQCCIMLFCDFVMKYQIDTGPTIWGSNFDKWIEWGCEYVPD